MGRRTGRPWERTLLCVIKALQGLNILVELQNDIYIRGVLDDCDDAMKSTDHADHALHGCVVVIISADHAHICRRILWSSRNEQEDSCTACDTSVEGVTIKDASMEDVEGNEKKLPLIFIRGSNIRFVHIPDSVNVSDAVEEMRVLHDNAALAYMGGKGAPPCKPGESSGGGSTKA